MRFSSDQVTFNEAITQQQDLIDQLMKESAKADTMEDKLELQVKQIEILKKEIETFKAQNTKVRNTPPRSPTSPARRLLPERECEGGYDGGEVGVAG